ncbi:PAB-dependent poly(A)-specific ribonuclease subunit 3 [Ophidiomyces ophidiicola]|uniref:PAB-dependent poly(A)-specific ribonuclease subunit 3 n=1 Tax=Ophidiomyces ophidiicola TaxID=1387563 RepID=UPI0020C50880|nr:PAB-dependent poly(A)-specific ribonuclease subunit 3 [Ophidiomyces ophidiicola]KAI1916372.1 PAB-dependent poly(A)-specific ribonuclease subunit 3 [Ophidiomyces ophidiicola]KAI1923808.1 PAB-dependent poly(A)-specific ribonuclease subunit 3 [Ophidiomyces ophidiicola]KAI1940310.1 PAB-dependent poly(A)-specific ribonuclease subunit 3 [Ophidiomyces ophidiicola]KAI1958973.1 PAB-dependent poly(A)-specific ribonuclease subunit 3 [Ophidiomyces ophidiicola]KAI1976505.1 PAB-dependent poly(A)-specific
MASAGKPNLDDSRRSTGSPKLKGREHTKDTLCRNVTIYGRCRYEDKGCAFNHDPQRGNVTQSAEFAKKRLNVDSPSFTPAATPLNGSSGLKKSATISPKAASAAPFLPKSVLSRSNAATPQNVADSSTPDWSIGEIQDFVPQGFDSSQVDTIHGHGNGTLSAPCYDPFVSSTASSGGSSAVGHQVQPNPYSHDPSAMGGPAFFGAQSAFQQPVQYHLYAPVGPHNQNILGYQRNVHDLFLPNSFREELQKKAAATLQTLPNSQLPAQIDYFHSLVPLDLSHQKNAAIFGYPSWVYKAQSSKDGNFYVLRRLEGFRLTNEKAIRSVQNWKRVSCGSVVTVHDAFTNRSFQDSSLVFVTDYHPLSKTLAEQHLVDGHGRYQNRHNSGHIPEQILWSYVTQIANALKAIHTAGLAARVIEPSKILLTSKNRVRLNACAILDVVQFDSQRPLADLQQQDLVNFGQLILALGVNSSSVAHNPTKAMERLSRIYSGQLNNSVFWLLNCMQKDQERTIDVFISGISSQLISTFDSSLHLDDQLISDLSRELENARLVRLVTKLNFINERPEYEHDRQWSENGERYFLKLFRDFVFHQVDAQNSPVVDLCHALTCLNKLDAGVDEKITLISRDEQSCFIVSYKELKKAVETSFQALLKPARRI